MRRVLVYSPDLMFFSQVKGTARACGWSAESLKGTEPGAGELAGDAVVIDANRELPAAWAVLEQVKVGNPAFVLVCHQHKQMEVAQEALRRGATEAVRRGALLTRLAERLGEPAGGAAPFVGEPTG